jgi:Tol biopolymer transport system component
VSAKHGFHGTVSFSPDGQSAYWSLLNYGGRFVSQTSMVANGRWTLPKPASFVGRNRYDDVPFPSPDGRKLFFVSTRPLEKGGPEGKESIWVMEKTDTGWSEPRPLPPVINTMAVHWQVSVDLKGNLYFGGTSGSGQGAQSGIFRAGYENGNYSPPERLGPAINGLGRNHSPYVAPDGGYLIYTRFRDNVMNLLISFRKQDGAWTQARELTRFLGISGGSLCPWVSQDGKYLFFLSDHANQPRPFWIEAGFIEELRKAELSSPSAVDRRTDR